MKGPAKCIDECHSSRILHYYVSAKHEKIEFNHPEHVDPDHIVKSCCSMMTASIYDAHSWAENLWQRGRSNGRRDYANVGRHIGQNYFKAFESAAPYFFGNKK